MSNTKLKTDLVRGSVGEQKIIDWLHTMDIDAQLNQHDVLSYYDIWFNYKDTKLSIEVKYDIYAIKSHNIAIEIFNTKTRQPSGIYISKADFWCHITDAIYFTEVDTLKKYIESTPPLHIIDRGGDNNAALYLYRAKKILNDIFIRLDNKREALSFFDTYVCLGV